MTVAELIKKLRGFHQELEVYAIDDLGYLSAPSADVRLVAGVGDGEVWVAGQEHTDTREALVIE